MKPKQVRNPEQTSARILAAAMHEFAAKGLGGARVDNIAARAKVQKRMLYHYFGNKDDLFRTVLEAAYAQFREAIRRNAKTSFGTCRVRWSWNAGSSRIFEFLREEYGHAPLENGRRHPRPGFVRAGRKCHP